MTVPVRSSAVLTALLLLLAAGEGPLTGQPPEESAPPDVLHRADELYFDHRPRRALDTLQRVLRDRPRAYGALWRAARAAVSVGLLQETTSEQNRWYGRGADYGRRASELRPDAVEGHYWLAASAGLHAVQAGSPRRIVELGEEVHAAATAVLDLDPRHAGAHNVLGRLNFEIMRLSFFERLLGRYIMGSDAIGQASWEGAERYLSRAVQLDPDFILYRLDLGRLHLHRDRPEEAADELRTALRLQPVHPPDRKFQQRARTLLGRIRTGNRSPHGQEMEGWRTAGRFFR